MFGNGAGMPNMNMQGMMFNNPNYNMQMPNMMNNGNFNMMPFFLAMTNNPNMNVPGLNFGGNEEWMKGYKIGMDEVNNNTVDNNPTSGDKKTIIFKTTQGVITNVTIDHGKTVSELLQLYLKRMGKAELINNREGICFVFNANKIPFDSPIKVGDFFGFNSYPNIIVNDVNNLIGA